MLFTSGLKGYVAPCGCTSNPLGGIAKLVRYVEDARAAGRAPVLVTSGNFLYAQTQIADSAREQEDARAALVADIYRQLGVVAQMPGPADAAALGKLANPWLLGAKQVSVGGMHVAFVPLGIAAPAADVVIALSDKTWDALVHASDGGADIIIAGGSEQLHQPQKVGRAWLVEAGEQGMYLGRLDFHPGGAGPWQFYDGGAGDKALLMRRLASLDKQLALAAQAVKPVLARQRTEVQRQIDALTQSPPATPTGRYFSLATVTLDKTMPDAASVQKQIAGYNATLCDLSKQSLANVTCATAEPHFVGSASCKSCHAEEFAQWQNTPHAHAVQTLESAGKLCDLGCIGCHTVGWQKPGGLCRPQDLGTLPQAGTLANVGCEDCHGPGSAHAAQPTVKMIEVPHESICRGCHTKEHSDLFDFAQYRPRIVHRSTQ